MSQSSRMVFAAALCAGWMGAGCASAGSTQPRADGAAEAEALATVQTLLDAWREADVRKAERVLHADFREVTLHAPENGATADGRGWSFTPVSRERLLQAMGGIEPGAWDDRLIDPVVHVDGPIAVVWSRYRFRTPYTENGVFHDDAHCGVETFQLYRFGEGWKIVNFADTHGKCDQNK